ncbi:MAG TPA: hypothetical protein VF931_12235 [Steroidobacteraceae bacterium]
MNAIINQGGLHALRGGQIERKRGVKLGGSGRKDTRPGAWQGALHEILSRAALIAGS